MRPGLKPLALVCILGTAAYLLFTWESTDPQPVQARQTTGANSKVIPQSALHSGQSEPGIITEFEAPPVVSAAPVASKLELLSSLPGALDNASPEQQLTAQKLLAFASSGKMADIEGLTRDEVLSLAELLTIELGSNEVAAALESQFGLPASIYLSHPNQADAIADLFDAIRADTDSTEVRPVLFTDRVESDGTVTGNVHVIPAGTKRVYAAFENQGAVQGLDRVLAVWRNPSDDRMVFTEFESVRAGSTYNYVWLELEDGWPAGFYKLDLFHPQQTTQLLASRSFNVR